MMMLGQKVNVWVAGLSPGNVRSVQQIMDGSTHSTFEDWRIRHGCISYIKRVG
jgi:hypothetical protein